MNIRAVVLWKSRYSTLVSFLFVYVDLLRELVLLDFTLSTLKHFHERRLLSVLPLPRAASEEKY